MKCELGIQLSDSLVAKVVTLQELPLIYETTGADVERRSLSVETEDQLAALNRAIRRLSSALNAHTTQCIECSV